jgi:phosphatidylglycerol:prolipoprotein diacylglycerol transferase
LAVSIFLGVYVADFLYRKFYEKQSYIFDFMPYVIILGIVGARLYYCVVNYSYYMANPQYIFYTRQGGLSIHGMLIVGITALYIFSKIYKMSFLKLADVFLCASALSQSIGRWGNFFNSEAFGTPTNLPWKLFIPLSHRPLEYINFEYFHPTFLYESILDFCIFLILLYCFKKKLKAGKIACLYFILYSIVRIFVEHFRIDSVLNIGGYPIAQVVSIVMFFVGCVGFGVLNFKKN